MTTLNLQVGTSATDSYMTSITNDAGRVYTGSGLCSLTDTNLSPGSHGSNDEWWSAARFTSVTIPNAATINSASLIYTCAGTYNAGSNVVAFIVAAHASDNSGALATTGGDLNNTTRPQTTAVSGTWTQTSVTLDTEYSISITSVIQEIVNRAGWASGNAITILVCVHSTTSLGEWQDYWSYDGSTTKAPKLNIDYTAGGGKAIPLRRLPQRIWRKRL